MIRKNINYISKNMNSGESGLTLLLAVFITAGLTLIALTISALTIQSVRNSRAVALSEPAIGQAHSGAEEGVWGIKRSFAVPTCSATTTGSQTLDTTSIYSARSFCKSFSSATFDLLANTPFTFYLYDPDDPNGDLDLSAMPDGGYSDMTITSNSGTRNLNIYITRLNGTPIGVQPRTVPPGGSITIINLKGPTGPTIDNRMQVTLNYCQTICVAGSETSNVTVTTDQGMPAFPTIDSTGCAQRGPGSGNTCTAGEIYSRRLEVTVPR